MLCFNLTKIHNKFKDNYVFSQSFISGLINLACRKTLVTQSSTGWGGDPLRAVDGSTDGVYERYLISSHYLCLNI